MAELKIMFRDAGAGRPSSIPLDTDERREGWASLLRDFAYAREHGLVMEVPTDD